MRSKTGMSPRKLLKDYYAMGRVLKEIGSLGDNVRQLERKLAMVSRRSDSGEGAIDGLEEIHRHLVKSQKELGRARDKLKRI